ncbi:SixA phosphatase family protein [Sphingomonas crusticola]|uniref:SixA phosphatase family protein n=1 Tax=Sphingomonas crusticola TaxID=1697973 RepID=UPI000E21E372|nr:histidine phosphatase family protein [Sphingomonas crusticola]
MKRLTLLRHAKSGDDGMVARDFDRPLNAKGRRAARAIGRHMRDAGLRFDAVVASPATRVAETLQEVEAGYGAGLSPQWERRIYLATAGELLDVVHAAPPEAESLLLVGHNPGLEQLALMLVPSRDEGSPRGEVAVKYPTASLAELSFAVDRWEDVDADAGELVRFVRPRDLDPELGPDYA